MLYTNFTSYLTIAALYIPKRVKYCTIIYTCIIRTSESICTHCQCVTSSKVITHNVYCNSVFLGAQNEINLSTDLDLSITMQLQTLNEL